MHELRYYTFLFIASFLLNFNVLCYGQSLFRQTKVQVVGLNMGGVDVRGEVAANFNALYFGIESGLSYSSSTNFSPVWHYYGELHYYIEEVNPGGNTLHYLKGYSALAQGITALAGMKLYLWSNTEILKIKYKANSGWSILPFLAGGAGVSYAGAELINGADPLNFGYEISEGMSFGICGEGTFGLDLYLNNNYKISGYAGGRIYNLDDLEALNGTGPYPDMIIRMGLGFFILF